LDIFWQEKGGVIPLALCIDAWVKYLIHITTWLFFLVNQRVSRQTVITVDGLKSHGSLVIKELEKEAPRQRGGTCLNAQNSMLWIEGDLKIEGASLGLHTRGLGRQPTLITTNFQSSESGTTPWC
jgi:hypothetical protein